MIQEEEISLTAVPQIKTNFADRLITAIKVKGNPVCVGLDPQLPNIPEFIKRRQVEKFGETFEAAANAFLEFNKGIIDAVCDIAPVVKPQIAFYEQYGFAGVWAYEQTCKYAKEKGLIVVADAKRNDIGSTASGYAGAFLGEVDLFGRKVRSLDADALTVTPYLGYDGVKPFTEACSEFGKGIFVLVKTSNPSSGDLQDQLLDEKVKESYGEGGRITNYALMSHLVESWGSDLVGESGYSAVGAVVGATHPTQAAEIRKYLPQAIFLVPGYGAQGGGAEDVRPCFNEDGLGAIVNSSRGIIFAYQKGEYAKSYVAEAYAEAARAATLEMIEDLKTIF